jgi:tRNA-binding protein
MAGACGQRFGRCCAIRGPGLEEDPMLPAAVKPPIDVSVLEQVDVRVGRIESVSPIEASDKLLALRVNFGDHTRTIVAGLKQERANPREIVGKQALFVVNIPPRKMRGVVSEGMLFDIGYADGVTPVLAVPESPVPDGTRAG